MNDRTPAEVFPPGELLRDELQARDWTQEDFAVILGRNPRDVNDIINAKRAVTPRTAKELAEALGTSAQLWLNIQAAYDLHTTDLQEKPGSVARRARLFTKAPLRKMIERGWIEGTDSVDVLESRLLDFLDIESLDQTPRVWRYAARKSSSYGHITAFQWAWLSRARQLARSVHANNFTEKRLEVCLAELRLCLHERAECRRVSSILAKAGVRLVIVQALPGGKLDGATFWLDRRSPVIALSFRYDRIDWFWFTLLHELGHVLKRDGLNGAEIPLDTNLSKSVGDPDAPAFEQAANQFASGFLVDQEALQGFITRVSPLFYTKKIVAFARRQGVHPGIVAGQLQNMKVIPFAHSRDLLEPVRAMVTDIALTDGWDHQPPVMA